jgi:hypothetical protein
MDTRFQATRGRVNVTYTGHCWTWLMRNARGTTVSHTAA